MPCAQRIQFLKRRIVSFLIRRMKLSMTPIGLSEGDRVVRQQQSKIKQLPNLAVCSGLSKEALEITTAQ